MKVFLVSPDERRFLWNAGDRAPLGLLYISSALTEKGIDNEVFDLNHYSREEFIRRVRGERPEWVGLSIPSSPSYRQMRNLAEKIKLYTKIVAGGPHISALPHSLDSLVEAVVLGYGEKGILKVIEGKRGIVKEKVDINEFPIPARNKLNPNNYSMWTGGLRTATIVTSRGCPYSCAFCASHERKVQFRKPKNMREEISQLKKQGYRAVYILDENLGVNKRHFEAVTSLFWEESMRYRMEMRAKDVTKEVAEQLKKTCCAYVALGCESGDNEVLKKANTGKTVEDNRRAIQILYQHRIPVKGFFIIGLPGETEETARKTVQFAEEMMSKGLTTADFYVLTPFPGSPIWDKPEKYGIKILSKDFDSYLQKENPVIETTKLSREKIRELAIEGRSRCQKLER
jgi:radical SAM superfamily enzyme YgiQ (UPF0313 family)